MVSMEMTKQDQYVNNMIGIDTYDTAYSKRRQRSMEIVPRQIFDRDGDIGRFTITIVHTAGTKSTARDCGTNGRQN